MIPVPIDKAIIFAALVFFSLRIRLVHAGIQPSPVPLDVMIPYDTPLIELSGENDESATNLEACTGECDKNADCAGSLECFQRELGEPIPGCTGGGSAPNWDYCYDPSLNKPVDVKYNFPSRRLLNPRIREGAQVVMKSRFAHHICYTLDGSNPKCHDRSIMNKVYCKPVLVSDSTRDWNDAYNHNNCKKGKMDQNNAWCALNKNIDAVSGTHWHGIDLKSKKYSVGYRIASRKDKHHNQATHRVKIEACDHDDSGTCDSNNLWLLVDDGKKYNGAMSRDFNDWFFADPIFARHWRFWPLSWSEHPSLRVSMIEKTKGKAILVEPDTYRVAVELPRTQNTRDYVVKVRGCDGMYGESPNVITSNVRVFYPYDSSNARFVHPSGSIPKGSDILVNIHGNLICYSSTTNGTTPVVPACNPTGTACTSGSAFHISPSDFANESYNIIPSNHANINVKAIGCTRDDNTLLYWNYTSTPVLSVTYNVCPGNVVASPAEINQGDSVRLLSQGASVICYSIDERISPACHATNGIGCNTGQPLLITDNTDYSGEIQSLRVDANTTKGGTFIRAVGCSSSLGNGHLTSIPLLVYAGNSFVVAFSHTSGPIPSGTILRVLSNASRVCVTSSATGMAAPDPKCNENMTACTVGHLMLPNSLLPWPILEDTEVKAIGCVYNYPGELPWPKSIQPPHTITESYSIIPGNIDIPSKVHDGQTITLRSMNATIICVSTDVSVVPICPSAPSAVQCSSGDIYEAKAHLHYSIQTSPVVLDAGQHVIVQAVGCRYNSESVLVSGRISNKTITDTVIQLPVFSPPAGSRPVLGTNFISITARLAVGLCYLWNSGVAPQCAENGQACLVGRYAVGNTTKAFLPSNSESRLPTETETFGRITHDLHLQAKACYSSNSFHSDVAYAEFLPRQSTTFFGTKNRDLCSENPLLPQCMCANCDAITAFFSLGYGGGRACNANPKSVSKPSSANFSSSQVLLPCGALGWAGTDENNDDDNPYVCGTGRYCPRSMLSEPACSSNGCWGQRGFVDAEKACQSIGARLCTLPEIMNGEAFDNDNCYDNDFVWTATPCNHACTHMQYNQYAPDASGHYVMWGAGKLKYSNGIGMERCVPDTSQNVGVKCCSTIARYHKRAVSTVYDDAHVITLSGGEKMCNGVKQDGWDNPTFHSPSQKYIPDLDGPNKGIFAVNIGNPAEERTIFHHCVDGGPLPHANCRYMHGPFRGVQDMTQHTYYPEGHALAYVVKHIDISEFLGKKLRVTLRMYAFNNWHDWMVGHDNIHYHDDNRWRHWTSGADHGQYDANWDRGHQHDWRNYRRHAPGRIHYRSRGAALDTGTAGNPYGFMSAYVKVYNAESDTNEMIWHRRVSVHDANCQRFDVYDGPLYNAQHWRKCFQTVDVIIEPPQSQTTLKLLIGVNLVEDQWDKHKGYWAFDGLKVYTADSTMESSSCPRSQEEGKDKFKIEFNSFHEYTNAYSPKPNFQKHPFKATFSCVQIENPDKGGNMKHGGQAQQWGHLVWHSPGCDPKAGVVFTAEHTKYGIPRWQSKSCIIPGKPGVNGGICVLNKYTTSSNYDNGWDKHPDRMHFNYNHVCNNFGPEVEHEKRDWSGSSKHYPYALPKHCSPGVASNSLPESKDSWFPGPSAHAISHDWHRGLTTLNFDGYTMFDFIDHHHLRHIGPDLILVDACTGKRHSKTVHYLKDRLLNLPPNHYVFLGTHGNTDDFRWEHILMDRLNQIGMKSHYNQGHSFQMLNYGFVGYKGLPDEVRPTPKVTGNSSPFGIFRNGDFETFEPQKLKWLYTNFKENTENGQMIQEPIERHGAPSAWGGKGNVSIIMSFNENHDSLAAAKESRFYAAIKGYGAELYQNISSLQAGKPTHISLWVASRAGYAHRMKYIVLFDGVVIFESLDPPPEGRFSHQHISFTPTSVHGLFVIRNLCLSRPTTGCHLYVDEISPQKFEFQETLRHTRTDPPAAFGMTLPVSAETYFAPNRWYNSISTVIYDDQITPSKVASDEFLCQRVDGSRFWHSSIVGCPNNAEQVASKWTGMSRHGWVDNNLADKVTAISWSESFNDPTEGRFDQNPLPASCEDSFIQSKYGGRGKSSCRTIHLHDKLNTEMYKKISKIPDNVTAIRIRGRLFRSDSIDHEGIGVRVAFRGDILSASSVPEEDWVTVESNWNTRFAHHHDWSVWRSYKDGALRHTTFYHGAHRSRNPYIHMTVNVMELDKTIPYPHGAIADGIWLHVFGWVNEGKEDEWWGFDKLEVTALHAANADNSDPIRNNCPGENCPLSCQNLLDVKSVEENIRGGLCENLVDCAKQMEQTESQAHHESCIVDLQARSGSTCAIAPFGGCRNICGDTSHDFWCARNKPFPDITFEDPSQEDSMSPKEVESIDVVVKGKFSLEATALQSVESNTGTVTVNNVTYGGLEYSGVKFGEHSCSDSCDTIVLQIPIAKKVGDNGVPYVYKKHQGDAVSDNGNNVIRIVPPRDRNWCISSIDIRACMVPSKATILQIGVVSGSNYSKDALLSAGGQSIILKGKNFGPTLNQVTYGPAGFGITAKNCSLRANNTEIKCVMSEGHGGPHRWQVIANGRVGEVSSATTSYRSPTMLAISPTQMPTEGGVTMTITGVNIGHLAAGSQMYILVGGRRLRGDPNAILDTVAFPSVPFDGLTITSSTLNVSLLYETLISRIEPPYEYTQVLVSNALLASFNPPAISRSYLTYGDGFINAQIVLEGTDFCSRSDCQTVQVRYLDDSTNSWTTLPQSSGSATDTVVAATSATISLLQTSLTNINLCKIQIHTTADHGLVDGDFVTLSGLIDVSEDVSFKVNKIASDEIILAGVNSTANFSEAVVSISKLPKTFSFTSATYNSLTLSMPPIDIYPVKVTVTVSGQVSNENTVGYRSPVIDSGGTELLGYINTTEGTNGFGTQDGDGLLVKYLSAVIGNVKVTFDGVNTNIIGIAEETDSSGDPIYRVSFDIPPGQGSSVQVRVLLGTQESQALSVRYPAPTITSVSPNLVFTNGSFIVIRGENFGTNPEVLAVPRANKGTCALHPTGVLIQLVLISKSHTRIMVLTPSGHGACTFGIIVKAGNQQSCDASLNDCTHFSFEFSPPVITSIETSTTEMLTRGSYAIKIVGVNFGGADAEVQTYIGAMTSLSTGSSFNTATADGECTHQSNTHTELICVVPEGEGKNLPLHVIVSGVINLNPYNVKFHYSPPRINRVTFTTGDGVPTAGKTLDTSADYTAECLDGPLLISKPQKDFLLLYFGGGLTAENILSTSITKNIAENLIWNNVGDWARRAKLVLHGSNFGRNISGTQKSVALVVGNTIYHATIFTSNHTLIELYVPPGEGAGVIRVSIEGNINQNLPNINYLPPLISRVTFPESNGKYDVPTSGCAEYEDKVDEANGARVCKSGKRALFSIRGQNFGIKEPQVVIVDMAGREVLCNIISHSHFQIDAELPEGLGPSVVRLSSNQEGFASARKAVSPTFEYSAPHVLSISWGESIDSAYTAWTFDAAGSSATNGKLFFFGENFGSTPTHVNISIGGNLCPNAQWHPASPAAKPPGTPYLTCEPKKTLVGLQSVVVAVAYHVVNVLSPNNAQLAARCFPGFYGRTGEYCVRCWDFLSADGRRSLSAATCSGRYTAPNVSTGKSMHNLSFVERGGSAEPVPTPGFATFPPPECNDGGCLPTLGSGGSLVPDACKPVYSGTLGWTKPDACTEAEIVGPLCHPDRFGGYCYSQPDGDITTCEKDPRNPVERYPIEFDFESRRYGCPRIEPCTPTTACAAGNVCTEGYVNYYEPFSLEKVIYEEGDDYAGRPYTKVRSTVPVCKMGHITLPNGTCFAPRCGQCNPKTHFRLDGLCQPCPEVPWLIPLIIFGGCMIAGIGTVALSRSGVSFVILNIAVDYMQVLSLFAGARVPWPPIMLELFINLRLFSIDIDLTAPECFIRELVTFEYKFYFKMSLPLLAMAFLLVLVFLIIFKRLLSGDFTVGGKIQKNVKRKKNVRVNPSSSKKSRRKTREVNTKSKRKRQSTLAKIFFPASNTTRKQKKMTVHGLISMVISMTVTVTYFLYLTIARAALDIHNCEPTNPPTGKFYMSAEPLEQCYVKGSLRSRLLPIANTALFFYTLGFPLVTGIFFRKYSHKIKEDQRWRAHGRGEYVSVNKAYFFRKKFSKLYYPFKPNYYWWCLLIIGRKFVIVVCSVLIKTDPTFQLSCVLCFMFLFMCLHIEFDPYMHVKERAEILRAEAESSLRGEFRRMQVIHMLMDLSQKSTTKQSMNAEFESIREKIHNMEVEMEIQHEIAHRLHRAWFNYNNIELVVLTCSVFVPLMGVMFNSEYLSRQENVWKQWIITVATIFVVVVSIMYLFACIIHEVRHTREFKRQRALILWSRLRHNRARIVKTMKLRYGIRSKKSTDAPSKRSNQVLRRQGTFAKKMSAVSKAESGPASVAVSTASSAFAEEHVEQLSQQHHHTHNMVNVLEEKFMRMMEKFEHMREENELQKQKLLEEQKKATKISLAAAVAANKVTSVLPQQSHARATTVSILEEKDSSTETGLKTSKSTLCHRLCAFLKKYENVILGSFFLMGLLALFVLSM